MIAQGEQTVNQFTNLGQQIGHAIETHAATQSAQAMLPALQQSYAQGMQKITSGDPSGMTDVYGAATAASQIPLLAPMATSALNTANSAMQQTMHNIRSEATQDALTERAGMVDGSDGMGKPLTANQRMNLQNKADAYGNSLATTAMTPLVAEDPKTAPAYSVSSEAKTDWGDASANDQKLGQVSNILKQYALKKTQMSEGNVSWQDPRLEKLAEQTKESVYGSLKSAEDLLGTKGYNKNTPVGIDPKTGNLTSRDGGATLGERIKVLKERYNNLDNGIIGHINNPSDAKYRQQSQGGIPAAQGGQSQNPKIQQGNASFKSPDEVKAAFQARQISKDQAVQLLQLF